MIFASPYKANLTNASAITLHVKICNKIGLHADALKSFRQKAIDKLMTTVIPDLTKF